ncbi:hypothetical protein [Stutzerimonas stutzeri]|uniref:Uncharacterized protein n=1 Tax=Stutzerimonas stutzeri TaxID=316 RepID=A0A2N8R950_STUST|nr:hypothetical protein [Stutzerimonas stutzeri]MCQ4256293.1 hypothetical protein [Stutzerimonas stutzeri]PNF57613.1 hypothetical protein CXK99_20710 [Stutzerimonas stutzeri]
MIRPTKQAAQEKLMTEEHKAMQAECEARRHEEGHKERVDAFNAKLIADFGKENCTFLIRSYT